MLDSAAGALSRFTQTVEARYNRLMGIHDQESYKNEENQPFELTRDGTPKLPQDFEGVIFAGLSKSYPSLGGMCDRFESGCCPQPILPEMRQLSMKGSTTG